jgi:hypothetical protein
MLWRCIIFPELEWGGCTRQPLYHDHFIIYSKSLVNLKLYNLKFCDNLNFSLNLGPKEDKFIQIYLVILKTLIICNYNEKSAL